MQPKIVAIGESFVEIMLLVRDVLRLGICQKIYTTQFSGERILHSENA